MPQLFDLYDADRRKTDSVVAGLASKIFIPHPLKEVRYADGIDHDTTVGRINSGFKWSQDLGGSHICPARPTRRPGKDS